MAPPKGVVAMGEIGLAGELRRVRDLPQRLAEAARLGFRMAIVPCEPGASDNSRGQTGRQVDGMQVLDVSTVLSALRAVRVTNGDRPGRSPLD
jgi:DNA repair protein RadA/Sms